MGPDGLIGWIGQYGSPGDEQHVSVAVDHDGTNVYVSGSTNGVLIEPLYTSGETTAPKGIQHLDPVPATASDGGSLDAFVLRLGTGQPDVPADLSDLGGIISNLRENDTKLLEVLQITTPGDDLVLGLSSIVTCQLLYFDVTSRPWVGIDILETRYFYPPESVFSDIGDVWCVVDITFAGVGR